MRTSIAMAAWIFLAVLLPTERSAGQDGPPTDRPYVFFSALPDESSAAPRLPIRELNLRPNQEQPYFIYVHNPTAVKQTVFVQLVSSPKKGLLEVAADKNVEVEARKTVRVSFTPSKAPAAPTMPGVKAAPTPGIALHANPHFRASIDGKLDIGARLGVVAATAYANTNASFGNDRLKITVSRKDVDMVGPPIHVRLIPRDRNGVALPQGLLAVEGNSLDGFLAIDKASDGAQSVELTLNTRNLGPIVDDGFAEVSIDGFARAYWGTLNGKAAAAPFGVSVPQAAIPGKPIPVQLLAQSDDGPVSIVFDRTGGEQIKRLPTRATKGSNSASAPTARRSLPRVRRTGWSNSRRRASSASAISLPARRRRPPRARPSSSTPPRRESN